MLEFMDYLDDQIEWSRKTFGNKKRTIGITKHIRKELDEILNDPDGLEEWIDVVILALDGAWRAGYSPLDIVRQLEIKQEINFNRKWPPIPKPDEVSEHIKGAE